MTGRTTRRAVLAGLGLALAAGGGAQAQYYYQQPGYPPPPPPPYGGYRPPPPPYGYRSPPPSYGAPPFDPRRAEERFGGPGPVGGGQLRALQDERNRRVLGLEQAYNAGRITRGQLLAGTRDADRELAGRAGR